MLKKEDGTDRLFTRIQALAGALLGVFALVGIYVKFSNDMITRDEKTKFLEYRLAEEHDARREENKAIKDNVAELAASVKELVRDIRPIIEPTKRINKWLDESTNGPRGK